MSNYIEKLISRRNKGRKAVTRVKHLAGDGSGDVLYEVIYYNRFSVYGFTDHWHDKGFPASDKSFETREAAEKHLARIGEKGFGHMNDKGKLGWVERQWEIVD